MSEPKTAREVSRKIGYLYELACQVGELRDGFDRLGLDAGMPEFAALETAVGARISELDEIRDELEAAEWRDCYSPR